MMTKTIAPWGNPQILGWMRDLYTKQSAGMDASEQVGEIAELLHLIIRSMEIVNPDLPRIWN